MRTWRWSDAASGLVSVLACVLATIGPAGLAATRVQNVPDAARDDATLRLLALEPRAWRALDGLLAHLLAALPLGTRVARASLGATLAVAVAGAVAFGLVRALLDACAETRRLGAVVAAVSVLLPLVGLAWQSEGSAIGGASAGAVLVLLPLAMLAARGDGTAAWTAGSFCLGLAVSYDPLVGGCALAGVAAFAAVSALGERSLRASSMAAWKAGGPRAAAAFVAGLTPLVVACARVRATGAAVLASLAAPWPDPGVASLHASPWAVLQSDTGPLTLLLAAGGLVLGSVSVRARPITAGLCAVALAGMASGWVHARAGTDQATAPRLAALVAVSGLAGVAMQALVRAVARANVPFARATATMVLLLVIVLPVEAADDALARVRNDRATEAWDDAAWGELPPGAVLLLTDRRARGRALAARARGALRDDVSVVVGSAPGPSGRRVLASDPLLLPLWRDLEIFGAPAEASLTALAAARPVVMTYEPGWGRGIAVHLVPEGLFDRFETEARGASDRKVALAEFATRRDRLKGWIRTSAELEAITARMLRARALLLATLDARDPALVGKAVEDLQTFAPADPVGTQILARLSVSGGAAHFEDLRP
jgi:hypothetical protein